MKTTLRTHHLFIVTCLLLSVFYFTGLASVPFHPDESTYLYMSSDFGTWIRNPFTLIWQQANKDDIRQHYREIDAPLTRYLLGLGNVVAGEAPLSADWDWGETWETNLAAGAFPTPQQLLTGRFTMATLFPLSLIFLYLTGIQIQGRTTGTLAVLMLGLNSLSLLHTRRAMAEGPLVFTTIFFLWAITHTDIRAWTLGTASAFAFNSKQSLAALFPVGFIASLWISDPATSLRKRLIAGGQFLIAFIGITLALNPVLWREPVSIVVKSLESRSDLLSTQVEDFGAQNPDLILDRPGEKLLAAIAQVYLLPPSFQEAGNYLENTDPVTHKYLAVPGHNLGRNLAAGGLFLTFAVFGIFIGLAQIRKVGWRASKQMVLFFAATGIQTTAILLVIPLPFQRYYMPLIPHSVLWSGYGLAHFLIAIKNQLSGQPEKGAAEPL